MACVPAPACKAALAQATALFPNRKRGAGSSDGICASPQHTSQNPTSDHETGDAVDITHDPANGCDINVLFARIIQRRDPRVKYLIFNRRILRAYDKPGIPAWTWSPYTGSNPHTKHGHISIHANARNNTTPWFGLTTPPQEEGDMPLNADDKKWLTDLVYNVVTERINSLVPQAQAPEVDVQAIAEAVADEQAERQAN